MNVRSQRFEQAISGDESTAAGGWNEKTGEIDFDEYTSMRPSSDRLPDHSSGNGHLHRRRTCSSRFDRWRTGQPGMLAEVSRRRSTPRVRIVVAPIEPRTPGAAMKDGSGS